MVTYIEREREIYNICTLAENITFICTSLRNRFLLLFHVNWTLPVKFRLWADPYFLRGVSGQLSSLKDSPDNIYIFVAYILNILGQREGVCNQMTPPSPPHTHWIRPYLLH